MYFLKIGRYQLHIWVEKILIFFSKETIVSSDLPIRLLIGLISKWVVH